MTRTTTAHLQRPLPDVAGVPLRLFEVGSQWTRTSWHRDPVSGLWFSGALLEPARVNRCLQSNTLATAPWAARGTATVVNNTGETTDPTGAFTAAKLTGIGDYPTNDLYQLLSGLTASQVYAPSLFLKRISTSGTITIRSPLGGSATVNLANIGTGWIWAPNAWTLVTPFSADSGGNGYVQICDETDSGLGLYVWCVGAEDNAVFASSPIVTTTGAVQRTADSKVEWLTTVPDEFAVQFVFSIPAHTPGSEVDVIYLDDGTANNRLVLAMDTAGKLTSYCKVGGVTQADVTPNKVATDGAVHRGVIAYQRGRLALGVGGTWLEASGDHIPGMDRLSIQPSGALVSVQFRNEWLTGQPRPVQPDCLAL